MTGNLENPVVRASWMTDSAESSRSTSATLGRGVMTSCAVWSLKARVRASRVAVSRSRLPCCAECCTSVTSSSAERAPESSSFGSMPNSRMMAFAVPFSATTAGLNTAVNATWNGMHHLAGLPRMREREVLRHELADDHREQRGDRDGHDRRADVDDGLRHARRAAAGRRSAC